MAPLIECVPNVSEGRDRSVLAALQGAIEAGEGVRLLGVDPGRATNRTVFTFVGEPEAVLDAAVRLAKKAVETIDMRRHRGEHPRFGALDVCPLVPVSGITMDETVEWARRLGRRLGEEAGITVYLYENAASRPERRNLAEVRAGEYEGLAEKLGDPAWAPDFGPAAFQPRSGATAVGARGFLVAYNVNLNTTSTRRANAVAFDVREKGRVRRRGDPLTGEVVLDRKGEPTWEPGELQSVKAIGWYIEEYGICQVSMNLTNLSVTPLHEAFDACCRAAEARGLRVTGSELVGLIPLSALLDAGRHYLRRQHRSTGVSDAEIVKIAVRSLGLADLAPFLPEERVIEYALRAGALPRLVDLGLAAFVEETASESPAPGGGSVSAAVGALGAALGTMVANLSSHKRGWDARWEEFSDLAERGKACHVRLTELVDRDTEAFEALRAAWRTDPAEREAAVEAATRRAIDVPLEVMETALASTEVLRSVAERGLEASVSDAGVGALCARTAVRGAWLNVRINARSLGDADARRAYEERGRALLEEAERRETGILAVVESKLGAPAGAGG